MGSVSTIYNGVRTWLAGRALMDVAFSNRSTNGVQNKIITAKKDEIEGRLDSIESDLVAVDISSSFTLVNNTTGALSAYKVGSMVIVCFDLNLPSSYTGDVMFLVATTSNYKPKVDVYNGAMRGVSNQVGTPCRVYLQPNGYLQVFCPSSSSQALRGSITYVC